MTTAGVITGAAGAVALTGGIYLMVRALPGVSVNRATPQASVVGVGGRF
jgi:hypothetical protein